MDTQATVNCIECDSTLEIPSGLMVGEIIDCADCGVELEVINDAPLTFEIAPEIEEDWGE